MKIWLSACLLSGILFTGCSVSKNAPKMLYNSNATGPVFIQQEGDTLRLQFETRRCLAAGFSATDQSAVTLPKEAVCGESTAATLMGWLGKTLSDIIEGLVKGLK